MSNEMSFQVFVCAQTLSTLRAQEAVVLQVKVDFCQVNECDIVDD